MQEDSINGAKLELMVLRASLPGSARIDDNTVSVPAGAQAVTVDQAARALARMPKPIVCTASVSPSGALSVACEPVGSTEQRDLHNSVIRGFAHDFGSHLSSERTTLLVRGSGERAGERLKLSLAAFKRWYQEYLPPLSVAFGSDEPSAAEEEGVAAVIRLFHVEPTDPDDIPSELHFLRP